MAHFYEVPWTYYGLFYPDVSGTFGGFDWLATKNDHKVPKIATFGHFWPFSTTLKAKKYLKFYFYFGGLLFRGTFYFGDF